MLNAFETLPSQQSTREINTCYVNVARKVKRRTRSSPDSVDRRGYLVYTLVFRGLFLNARADDDERVTRRPIEIIEARTPRLVLLNRGLKGFSKGSGIRRGIQSSFASALLSRNLC